MTILNILEYPDPRLRKVAEPVTTFDHELKKLVDDMFETMYDCSGVGLAATQVDVHKRLIVIDVSEEKNERLVVINPEYKPAEQQLSELQEGCLSVPGFYEKIDRFDRIVVNALDIDGNPYEMEADGLLSVCIQHEIDHLDGKLFVDYLSTLKQQRIRKKLQKLHKRQA